MTTVNTNLNGITTKEYESRAQELYTRPLFKEVTSGMGSDPAADRAAIRNNIMLEKVLQNQEKILANLDKISQEKSDKVNVVV